jgi:hypothetical protein
MIIQPCDILFARSHGWLGRSILRFTRSPREAPSIATHTGIFTMGGDLLSAMLVEAQVHCNRHPLGEAYPEGCDTEICIFRPINLAQFQIQLIVDKAASYVGDNYGYGKLLLCLGDWCLGGANVFRRLGRIDSVPICSFLVARSFKAAALDFGIADYAATPDDIWDFVTTHKDKYKFLYQRGTMYKE